MFLHASEELGRAAEPNVGRASNRRLEAKLPRRVRHSAMKDDEDGLRNLDRQRGGKRHPAGD